MKGVTEPRWHDLGPEAGFENEKLHVDLWREPDSDNWSLEFA